MHGTASYGDTAACCWAVGEVRELKSEPKTMLPENQQSRTQNLRQTWAHQSKTWRLDEGKRVVPSKYWLCKHTRREHGVGGWELQLAVGKPPSHPAVITSYFVLVILLGVRLGFGLTLPDICKSYQIWVDISILITSTVWFRQMCKSVLSYMYQLTGTVRAVQYW